MLQTLLFLSLAFLPLGSATSEVALTHEPNFWSSFFKLLGNCTVGGEIRSECIRTYLKLDPSELARSLCLNLEPKYNSFLPHLVYGAALGLLECQKEFTNERWNCSVSSLGLMKLGTLEQQYVAAIVSAGITRQISIACSANQSLCPPSPPPPFNSTKFAQTKRCQNSSDNVEFGLKFYRLFIEPEIFNLTTFRYSSKLGAKTVSRYSEWKVCWMRENWVKRRIQTFHGVPTLKRVARHLRKIYDEGCTSSSYAKGFKCDRASPDYCTPNKPLGSLGTKGRECNPKSSGPNGCSKLCCKRGYLEVRGYVEYQCNCGFVWCCEVKCEMCQRERIYYVCKK